MQGSTPNKNIDPTHDLYPSMARIAERSNELYKPFLDKYGVEVAGASDIIRRLAALSLGTKLAIATNAIAEDATIFLDKYNLEALIPSERRTCFEQIHHPKPDPECFDLAFKSSGLPDTTEVRRSVLAFEDNPRGMRSAKTAGLFVCAITPRYDREEPELLSAQLDLIADSHAEFSELLGLYSSRQSLA